MDSFPDVSRPVIALGIDYADGYSTAPHRHRRDQLLYGMTGVVTVTTPQGAWMMPPQRGMWIPAGVVHDVLMVGPVKMRSLYLEPGAVSKMPDHCQVVGISDLMRNLLAEAVGLPTEYEMSGRQGALMALLLQEIPLLPALPLTLPLPQHEGLARLCRRFLLRPASHDTIDEWRRALHMSRRSFTRLFRRETGLSFVAWRQQACIMAALPRLAAGEPVTTVALDFGYDNPASFTTMFKKLLGSSPRTYIGNST